MAERGSLDVGDDLADDWPRIPLIRCKKALAMKERVVAAGVDAIVVWDRSRTRRIWNGISNEAARYRSRKGLPNALCSRVRLPRSRD